jgi:hypothetical protein
MITIRYEGSTLAGCEYAARPHLSGGWSVSGVDSLGHRWTLSGYGVLPSIFSDCLPVLRFDLASWEAVSASLRGEVPDPCDMVSHCERHGIPVEYPKAWKRMPPLPPLSDCEPILP